MSALSMVWMENAPGGAGRRRLGRKTIRGKSQEACHGNASGNVKSDNDLEQIPPFGNLSIPPCPFRKSVARRGTPVPALW